MSSPPQSPPLAARHTSPAKHTSSMGGRARRGGAAYKITEECERLFCETLRAVFLGEGSSAVQDSLVIGMQNTSTQQRLPNDISDYGVHVRRYPDRLNNLPSPEEEMGGPGDCSAVQTWIEVWDYVGGNRFRGFVADKDGETAMFVFFDKSVVEGDLKAGYVFGVLLKVSW